MEKEIIDLLKVLVEKQISFKMSIRCPDQDIYKSISDQYFDLFPKETVSIHGLGDATKKGFQLELESWGYKSIWDRS